MDSHALYLCHFIRASPLDVERSVDDENSVGGLDFVIREMLQHFGHERCAVFSPILWRDSDRDDLTHVCGHRVAPYGGLDTWHVRDESLSLWGDMQVANRRPFALLCLVLEHKMVVILVRPCQHSNFMDVASVGVQM
jgi:hypothetical protein